MNTRQTELTALLDQLRQKTAHFSDVLAFIDHHYQSQAVAFTNGDQVNSSDDNQGSAKVFSLAKLFELSQQDTLHLFAEHYQSVLDTPNDNNHANIRNFIQQGWDGLILEKSALITKD